MRTAIALGDCVMPPPGTGVSAETFSRSWL